MYMFAVAQLLACYGIAAAGILILAMAVTCQRLSRLVYSWSSSSAAVNASTSNGKV